MKATPVDALTIVCTMFSCTANCRPVAYLPSMADATNMPPIASTLASMISTGRTGKLFIEFALTLAGAVLVSGFTALTLSPMMSSKLLKHEEKHGAIYQFGERVLRNVSDRIVIELFADLAWTAP